MFDVDVPRLTLDIDDDLLARAAELYALRGHAEVVDFALRRLLVEPIDVGEALGMRGSGWAGDLDEMRDGTSPRA